MSKNNVVSSRWTHILSRCSFFYSTKCNCIIIISIQHTSAAKRFALNRLINSQSMINSRAIAGSTNLQKTFVKILPSWCKYTSNGLLWRKINQILYFLAKHSCPSSCSIYKSDFCCATWFNFCCPLNCDFKTDHQCKPPAILSPWNHQSFEHVWNPIQLRAQKKLHQVAWHWKVAMWSCVSMNLLCRYYWGNLVSSYPTWPNNSTEYTWHSETVIGTVKRVFKTNQAIWQA